MLRSENDDRERTPQVALAMSDNHRAIRETHRMTNLSRRNLLKGTAIALIGEKVARAGVVSGHLPWEPNAGSPPQAVPEGPWVFFTAAEAAAVEALADRIIPPDPQTPGGKEAGCAVFIDRQLAGPYGRDEGLYNRGPFIKGTKTQGPQSAKNPGELYRSAHRRARALLPIARPARAGSI